VKYRKVDEASGLKKLKTTPFLVDAISCTEAESRITKEMDEPLALADVLTTKEE